MTHSTKHMGLAAISAAALLVAAPAFAQPVTEVPVTPPAATEVPVTPPAAMEQSQASPASPSTATVKTTELVGKSVWSSEGTELGPITKVNLGPNGAVESIHFTVGSMLGIGGKTVVAKATDFTQNDERIKLKIDAASANSLPEFKA